MADDTSNRGFASMDPQEVEEIARKGGEKSGGNKSSGSNTSGRGSKEGQIKGGKHSHGGGRRSSR